MSTDPNVKYVIIEGNAEEIAKHITELLDGTLGHSDHTEKNEGK